MPKHFKSNYFYFNYLSKSKSKTQHGNSKLDHDCDQTIHSSSSSSSSLSSLSSLFPLIRFLPSFSSPLFNLMFPNNLIIIFTVWRYNGRTTNNNGFNTCNIFSSLSFSCSFSPLSIALLVSPWFFYLTHTLSCVTTATTT